MSQLTQGQAAKVKISFKLNDGTVVPTTPDGAPMDFVVGESCGFQAIDNVLPSMSIGETKILNLQPEEAFGMPDPNLRIEIPRAQVNAEQEIQPGMQMQIDNGGGQKMVAIVHEVTDQFIRVDANHPLAGEALECSVEVMG